MDLYHMANGYTTTMPLTERQIRWWGQQKKPYTVISFG